MCKGIVDEIISGVVQQVEEHRTAQVFSQLDTPIRDWVLGQDMPPQIQIQAQGHQRSRPVTPTIHMPKAGEGWSPVSTPEHTMPVGTP